MKARKFVSTLLLLALCAAIASLIYQIDRVIIAVCARIYHLDVSYADVRRAEGGWRVFKDLKVMDPDRGVGFFSRNARVRGVWRSSAPTQVEASFELAGVNFITTASIKPEASADISTLVLMPFKDQWKYDDLSGKVCVERGLINVEDLEATSADIRLSIRGALRHDDSLNADIVLYFSKNIVDKMPDDLTKIILSKEGLGWNSIRVHVEGNFRAPSIQISGKQFRLRMAPKGQF